VPIPVACHVQARAVTVSLALAYLRDPAKSLFQRGYVGPARSTGVEFAVVGDSDTKSTFTARNTSAT